MIIESRFATKTPCRSVPDLYKVGRVVVVNGKLTDGRFLADKGSLSTKCPSKYAPAKSSKA